MQVSILWILSTINAQIECVQRMGSVKILPHIVYVARDVIYRGFSCHVLTTDCYCHSFLLYSHRVYLFLRLMTSSVYQNVQLVTMNLRFMVKARNVLGHVLQVISQKILILILKGSVKSAGM